MISRQSEEAKARRAMALKENLKRRKNQARAKAKTATGAPSQAVAKNSPVQGPKSAAKAE
jgi:hypothetical protein